jgi:hypothetical protein
MECGNREFDRENAPTDSGYAPAGISYFFLILFLFGIRSRYMRYGVSLHP